MIYDLNFSDGRTMKAGTLFCVASNYSKHAKEMGTAIPTEPSIFIKPPQAIIPDGGTILLQAMSENVHHEVELVLVIGKECINVSAEEAVKYIAGYAVGIDVTMRDVQAKAKAEGKPWAIAKGFVTSAPLSQVIPVEQFTSIPDFNLELEVNGVMKQKGRTSEMERSPAMLIEYLSKVFTLYPGDCIFTGTPEGVGKINSGDNITARLNGFAWLNVKAI